MQKMIMSKKNGVTIQEGLEYFLRICVVKNLSELTIKTYKNRFTVFQEFLQTSGCLTTAEITANNVDDFILYLKNERQVKDITINSYLRDLRAILNYFMEESYTPTFKVKMIKTTKEIKKTYTDSELKRLLDKPNVKKCDFTEYKIWVLSNYLLGTGNRISSALSIKIGDIDFDNGIIQVNKTKNRKAQIIPLSATLSAVLIEYLTYRKGDSGDYLFCNTVGAKPDMRTYTEMLEKYNHKRGVDKKSAHLYRHTFAKKWILNGGDISACKSC